MRRFAIRPEIYYSDGAVASLARLGVKRVLIIIDPVMLKNGAGESVEQAFAGKNDVIFSYYADIKPDPELGSLTDGVQTTLRFQPDLIVAVGGGSAIDYAKTIVFLCAKIGAGRGGEPQKPRRNP